MNDIIKYLEVRRTGHITGTQFWYGINHTIGSNLEDTQDYVRTILDVDDAIVLHNRLLILDSLGAIKAYDVSPKAVYFSDPTFMSEIASWSEDISLPKHKLSRGCVEWSKDGQYFTVSGKGNTLTTIDGNEFSKLDKIVIPNADYTTLHQTSPHKEHLIAVATSPRSLALIDMRTGNVSLSGPRGNGKCVTSLAWSPCDNGTIMAGNSSEVFLWDLRAHSSPLHVGIDMGNSMIPEIQFIDRTTVAVLSDRNRLVVYDLVNRIVLSEMIRSNSRTNIKRCKFAVETESRPMLLFLPFEQSVYIHELLTGRFVKKLNGHYEDVSIVVQNDRTKELLSFDKHECYIWRPNCYMI